MIRVAIQSVFGWAMEMVHSAREQLLLLQALPTEHRSRSQWVTSMEMEFQILEAQKAVLLGICKIQLWQRRARPPRQSYPPSFHLPLKLVPPKHLVIWIED